MMNLLNKRGSYPHCIQNYAVVKANITATNFRVYEVH